MKISTFCENTYMGKIPFSSEKVEDFAQQFVLFLFEKNLVEEFSKEYDYQLEITICDNEFIHKINLEYRYKDIPTDVITFALYNDSEDKILVENEIHLGQIIISADKVKEQAQEHSVTPEYEFLNLLAHGILHLFGYDHLNEEDLENMLDLQKIMIESVEYVEV